MERVVGITDGGESVAIPFSLLQDEGVVTYTLVGRDLVVFHAPGTASALDSPWIPAGRDVGATNVFRPTIEGRSLTFAAIGGGFIDLETGSAWNILGEASAGPLAGARLEPVVHGNHFWFAWAVFRPDTVLVTAVPRNAVP